MDACGLTIAQDDDGWDIAICDCGWVSPPCPGTDIAAEFYTDHRVDVEQGDL